MVGCVTQSEVTAAPAELPGRCCAGSLTFTHTRNAREATQIVTCAQMPGESHVYLPSNSCQWEPSSQMEKLNKPIRNVWKPEALDLTSSCRAGDQL